MYNYGQNTLIHSVGFNFATLESIFKHGILSFDEAKKEGVVIARNHSGYNLDDAISLIRYCYINPDDNMSAYSKYVMNGISFIVEDVPIIYNRNERIINHADEVLALHKIPLTNIKGLIVPFNVRHMSLKDLDYLPLDSTSYVNIKKICDNLIAYLNQYGRQIDMEEYNQYLIELYLTNEAINKIPDKNSQDYLELVENFYEVVKELNEFFQVEIFICFAKLLNNKDVTLMDLVNYLNSKYHNLEIYNIPFYVRKKGDVK